MRCGCFVLASTRKTSAATAPWSNISRNGSPPYRQGSTLKTRGCAIETLSTPAKKTLRSPLSRWRLATGCIPDAALLGQLHTLVVVHGGTNNSAQAASLLAITQLLTSNGEATKQAAIDIKHYTGDALGGYLHNLSEAYQITLAHCGRLKPLNLVVLTAGGVQDWETLGRSFRHQADEILQGGHPLHQWSAVLLCQDDISVAESIAFKKSRDSAIRNSTGRREVVALVNAGELQKQVKKVRTTTCLPGFC